MPRPVSKLPGRSQRMDPSPRLSVFITREVVTGSETAPKYLADKKAGNTKGICDIHVIDVYLNSTRSSSWVFDTDAVAHICTSKQELRNKRRLAKDEVTMRVRNGSKVDVIAVGTLPLHLPIGLVLNLNNCYLVPALSMNILSRSHLIRDG